MIRRPLAVFLIALLNAQFLCMFGFGAASLVQPLFAQTPIVRFVSSGVDCASDDWLNCPTLTTGSVTAGSDTTGDGSSGNPWQTVCYALAQMASTLGNTQSGAGSVLIARRGAYDTQPCNGLRTAFSNGEVAMLSGNGMGSSRFMFRAYKQGGANNYVLECDPLNPPLPGGVYGGEASTCEHVMLYRSQIAGAPFSVAKMQSATCNNGRGDNPISCVGVPTQNDCIYLHSLGTGYSEQYPPGSGIGGCWEGSPAPGPSGTGGLGYLAQYRESAEASTSLPILEWDVGLTFNNNNLHHVVWDGISVNGRGVTKNLYKINYNYSTGEGASCGGCLTVSKWEIRNATFGNATQSCQADQVNGVQENGYPYVADIKFYQVKYGPCGVPFDTYTFNGQLMRSYTNAAYLHGLYAHFGFFICEYCELGPNAGDGLGIESMAVLKNSFVHNNTAVHTSTPIYGAGGSRFFNNVFTNNAGANMRVRGGAGDYYFNNTFFSTYPLDSPYPAAMFFQGCCTSGDLVENNVISGFQYGILLYTTFEGSTGNTARNNIFLNRTTGNSFGLGDPAKRPITDGGGNQFDVDPLMVDPAGNNYTLQSSSPARAAGNTACLSYTAPTWVAGIGNGSKTGQAVFAYTDIDWTCQYDIAGNSRGSTPDMGAFQFGSGAGTQPVNTVIDTGPTAGSMTVSTSATFTYHGTGGTGTGYTYECQIDGGGYSACNSGTKSYTSLSVASHTFMVKATDDGAEVDATPASRTWSVVEEVPPNTSITACPSNGTATSVSIAFTNSGCIGTCTDQCELDGGGYGTCTTPKAYSGLSVGDHNFSVRAVDGGTSLTDPTPATCTWTQTTPGGGSFAVGTCIEVITPSLNVRDSWNPLGDVLGQQHSGARGLITATDPTVSGGFTGINVDYYLGDAALDGWHSTNTGNVTNVDCEGGTPTNPDTSITSNPALTTTERTATFTFTASGCVGTCIFECSLDLGGYSVCTSPSTYLALDLGNRLFQVRAVDDGTGLTDPSPAEFSWEILFPTTGPKLGGGTNIGIGARFGG